MRNIFNNKSTLVAFIIISLLLFSCKKKKEVTDTTPAPVFNGTTYWECVTIELTSDTIFNYYTFSLQQEGNLLVGDIKVRDSVEMINGTISGSVTADSVFINADFSADDLDFSFSGVVDNSSGAMELSGSLQTAETSVNGNDKILLYITQINADAPPQIFDNPYVFRKVSSSSHPKDYSVIFIHGMTGNLTHWDEVIANLTPEFKDKHDVYVYQYNWKDSIAINGRILYDSIVAAGLTNPIIVGHSMGGLVARAYISKGGDISKFVGLGTPNLGTPLARLINLFPFSLFPGPKDMSPESEFIQKLTNNQNDINNRSKYVVFGGQMKGGFKWVKNRLKWVWAEDYYNLTDKVGYNAFNLYGKISNDGLVPNTSALFQGYNVLDRKPILEWVDHRNLRTPDISTEIMDYINNL